MACDPIHYMIKKVKIWLYDPVLNGIFNKMSEMPH